MASVKHLGLFPWCPYKNKQDVADRLYFGNTSPIDQQISIFEGLSMPLSDAVAMYWRVKTWRVHGYINATSGLTDENGDTIWDQIDFDLTFGPQISSETQYVCRHFDGNTWLNIPWSSPTFSATISGLAYSTTFTFDIIPFYSPFLLSANNRFGFAHFASWPQDNTPSIDASMYVWTRAALSDSAGGDIVYTQLSDFDGEDKSPVSIPISFLGKQYTLNKFVLFAEGGTGSDFNIEATEYWPYDPEDGGGPIYDTSSGAIIRPDYFKPNS